MGGQSSAVEANKEQESKTNPWQPAEGGLKNLLGRAEAQLDKGERTIDRDTDYMYKMQGRLEEMYKGSEAISAKDINKKADEFTDHDFVDSLKDNNQKTINQTLAGQNVQATGSGNQGSSRAGLAEGSAIAESNSKLNSALLDYRNQNVDRATANLQGNQDKRMSALNNLYKVEGGIDDRGQNAEWERLQKALSIIGGIGGLGGQSVGTSKTGSNKQFNPVDPSTYLSQFN